MTTFNKREIELIDGLRNNWTAFAGLTEEQRGVMMKAGPNNCCVYAGNEWRFQNKSFSPNSLAYRPAPDFIPTPEPETPERPSDELIASLRSPKGLPVEVVEFRLDKEGDLYLWKGCCILSYGNSLSPVWILREIPKPDLTHVEIPDGWLREVDGYRRPKEGELAVRKHDGTIIEVTFDWNACPADNGRRWILKKAPAKVLTFENVSVTQSKARDKRSKELVVLEFRPSFVWRIPCGSTFDYPSACAIYELLNGRPLTDLIEGGAK